MLPNAVADKSANDLAKTSGKLARQMILLFRPPFRLILASYMIAQLLGYRQLLLIHTPTYYKKPAT